MIFGNSETILNIAPVFSPYIWMGYPHAGEKTFNNYLINFYFMKKGVM